MQAIATKFFDLCVQRSILLEIAWVPRILNFEADDASKIFDWDDWGVSEHIFKFLNAKWGPFTVDWFANNVNNKLNVFYSKFWCPGTSGVDAFAYNWGNQNNWVVPPVNLVPRVLQHMFVCKAEGTLIVPKWESAIFWPLLVNIHTREFQNFVTDFIEYCKPSQFFIPGSCKHSVFAISPFNGNVLALKIRFS